MALGYSILNRNRARGSAGPLQFRIVDITLDNAYPAGGWALNAQSLGLGSSGEIVFVDISPIKSGYSFEYDQVNQKLKAYQNGAGSAPNAELANNSAALNAIVLRAMVVGLGAG